MGLIFVPGGAMEIVVGALALEFELVSKTTFVAIVFAALASSIAMGPLVSRFVGQPDEEQSSGPEEI